MVYILLTPQDRLDIETECRHQNALHPQQIIGMTEAYKEMREYALIGKISGNGPDNWLGAIRELGYLIEPNLAGKWRTVPAVFANGNYGLNPELIPRAMDNFVQKVAEKAFSPDLLYKEFEEIHPFEDGNGRVGHLLWKLFHVAQGSKWPDGCPPDLFISDVLDR